MKSKKKTKKTEKPEEVQVPYVPEPELGCINVQFTAEELGILVKLLDMTAETYNQMAESSSKEDLKTTETFLARVSLCRLFHKRLVDNGQIGEPDSRSIH